MKVFFIAEVSKKIGIGHFKRSMSLYQYFKSKKLKSEFIVFTSKNNEKEKINSILSKITKSKFNICSINIIRMRISRIITYT